MIASVFPIGDKYSFAGVPLVREWCAKVGDLECHFKTVDEAKDWARMNWEVDDAWAARLKGEVSK